MSATRRPSPLQVRSVVDLIGNTPLLALDKVAAHVAPVRVFAKAEWYNPGGSVKDRAALGMIRDGERRGVLTPDKVLLDATSGNRGNAYARIAVESGRYFHPDQYNEGTNWRTPTRRPAEKFGSRPAGRY